METKKKVDEAWKDRVKKEKGEEKTAEAGSKTQGASAGKETQSEEALPDPDFSTFISGLGMQALLLLGEISNPEAKDQAKPNYQQARYTIDLIDMLQKKTEGNLKREEASFIENLLYDLRMRYLKCV